MSYPTAAICDGVRLGYVSIFENLKQFKIFIFVCPTNRHVRREQRTGAHPADRRRRSRVTFESTVNVTINRNSSPGKGLCQFTLCHVVTLPYWCDLIVLSKAKEIAQRFFCAHIARVGSEQGVDREAVNSRIERARARVGAHPTERRSRSQFMLNPTDINRHMCKLFVI